MIKELFMIGAFIGLLYLGWRSGFLQFLFYKIGNYINVFKENTGRVRAERKYKYRYTKKLFKSFKANNEV